MPSFDVVSEVDLHELRNAVDQASREIKSRFDFRGVDTSFELGDSGIQILAEEDFQLRQMQDILRDKMARRGIDGACLDPRQIEGAGKQRRQLFGLKQGIDRGHGEKDGQDGQGFQAQGAGADQRAETAHHRQEARRPAARDRHAQGSQTGRATAIRQFSGLTIVRRQHTWSRCWPRLVNESPVYRGLAWLGQARWSSLG